MRSFRVAMVGSGRMATEWAKTLSHHNRFELAGVHSLSDNNAEDFSQAFGVPSFGSVEELYDGSLADAVIIAISELSLEEVMPVAMEFPWLRLVEKPFGIDLEQSHALAAIAQKEPHRTFVALNRRYYSSTQTLLESLSAEEDRARFIRITDQQDIENARFIGKPERVLENWMFANAVHTVDLFRVFGRGEWTVEKAKRTRLSEEAFVLTADLSFSSGDRGTYTSLWNTPGGWSLVCNSADSAWEMRPLEKLSHIPPGAYLGSEVPLCDAHSGLKPGLWNMLDELALSLEKKPHQLTSVEDNLETVRLIAEIYRAEFS